MSSEIRISCIFALAGLAILGSMQNYPYAFPGAVCCLLIAAILVWQELGCRNTNAVEGKAFNDKLSAALEESLKTGQAQNELLKQCIAQMNDQNQKVDGNQGKLLEALYTIQAGQSSMGNTVNEKLDHLHEDFCNTQTALGNIQEKQASSVQALNEKLGELITTVKDVHSILAEIKESQTANGTELGEKLDDLHKDFGHAQSALDDIKNEQSNNDKTINENINKLHAVLDEQKKSLEFLGNIDDDLRPMYKFFQSAGEGINAQSIQDELTQANKYQKVIRENTENLDMLKSIKTQIEDSSDSLQNLSSIPKNLENFVNVIQAENQKAGKAQQGTLDALNKALDQSRTLTTEDAKILTKILQNVK